MTGDNSKFPIADVAVLFAINKPHTDNIRSGNKTSELRLRPPKVFTKYRMLIYETKRYGGCGKVIGEAIAINRATYRYLENGVPLDLLRRSCLSRDELLKYTGNGKKEVTEISISDLKIYDSPKDLDDFLVKGKSSCNQKYCYKCWYIDFFSNQCDMRDYGQPLFVPPQSWCYVEELK